ncbi:MAG: carbohydrate kinase family protein [Solirubrobacteraceae bacterium]
MRAIALGVHVLDVLTDLVAGGRALLAGGVGGVAATRGADGAVVVTADGVAEVPAFPVDVVDTTGCGDAFSAGFLRGLSLELAPADAAYDLATVQALLAA